MEKSHQLAQYIFIDINKYPNVHYCNNINQVINKLKNVYNNDIYFQDTNTIINVFVCNKKIAIILGIDNNDFKQINEYFTYQKEYELNYINFKEEDECDNCGGYSCQEYCVNDDFDY